MLSTSRFSQFAKGLRLSKKSIIVIPNLIGYLLNHWNTNMLRDSLFQGNDIFRTFGTASFLFFNR
jgi:hypothetical protein